MLPSSGARSSIFFPIIHHFNGSLRSNAVCELLIALLANEDVPVIAIALAPVIQLVVLALVFGKILKEHLKFKAIKILVIALICCNLMYFAFAKFY